MYYTMNCENVPVLFFFLSLSVRTDFKIVRLKITINLIYPKRKGIVMIASNCQKTKSKFNMGMNFGVIKGSWKV